MKYIKVIWNFAIEWKALIMKKEKNEPATPKLTKGVTVMQWSESFSDILHCIIGVRNVPLAYVIWMMQQFLKLIKFQLPI